MIHKQVIEYAREHPTATYTEIAEHATGVSPAFVEQVLDQYGDPAQATADRETKSKTSTADHDQVSDEASTTPSQPSATVSSDDQGDSQTGDGDDVFAEKPADGVDDKPVEEPADEPGEPTGSQIDDEGVGRVTTADPVSSSDPKTTTDGGKGLESIDGSLIDGPSQLSERQYDTLRAVADDPTATQAEIADRLGVSRATISKRLTDIDGFEWDSRETFVHELFEYRDGVETNGDRGGEVGMNGTGVESGTTGFTPANSPGVVTPNRIEALEGRLDSLEDRFETSAGGALGDPALLSKVVHAIVEAEYISRDEELRILAAVVPGEDTPEE